MILVTRPNYLKLHKLTICLAVWHVVGNQKPLKGPSELFNVFINDIFLFIKDSSLYNYADDNTLSFGSPDFDLLISTLHFFYLFGIFLRTKMPGQRAKVKITKNKSMENCKFV
jgi:hypothetical protein